MNLIQTGGLIVWTAFYGNCFAKVLVHRRKGVRTDMFAGGRKSEMTLHVEKMLKRSVYAIAFIQLCSIFISDPVIAWILPQSCRLVGLGLAWLGLIVFCVAMYTLRNSWRVGFAVDEQTSLVTNGIYRYSRNPAFLGFDMLYIGLAVAFCNGILIFISLMGVVLMHLQVIEEEKHLSGHFGEAYQAYKKRTPRYFFF
ncbi:MAG: isoprenylcysteine carboxylmethyltransferase family protein [Tannerella sp.]|jgi:protein-S-isoprenylcysteine O-methyltransferase Ste14|nr:isoprenylcysteine carboxylmethyltransferase family protein [Tannerella sp.]